MHRGSLLASFACFAMSVGPALSQQKEVLFGRSIAAEIERRDGSFDDPSLVSYLRQIADRLAPHAAGKSMEVRVTRGLAPFASLAPPGILYLSGAMLKRVENEAELAGLIAHQLAHASAFRALHQTQGQGNITFLVPECILASPIAPAAWWDNRREPERLATEAAVQTLRAAGYDPAALPDLLSRLIDAQPGQARVIVEEDLLQLRAALPSAGMPQGGYVLDTSQFASHHARLLSALGYEVRRTRVPSLYSSPRR